MKVLKFLHVYRGSPKFVIISDDGIWQYGADAVRGLKSPDLLTASLIIARDCHAAGVSRGYHNSKNNSAYPIFLVFPFVKNLAKTELICYKIYLCY